MVLLKVVSRLKIYQHTKFHSPTLNGSSFASISEVHFGMVEATGLTGMSSSSSSMASPDY
jgi:hypothetical protein